MLNKILLLMLLLLLAMPASAQTATPAPCNAGVDVGNLNIGGNCQSNTIDTDTKSDLYKAMATAAYDTNRLPERITNAGPNGQRIVPDTSGAKQIFGYVKWVFSPNTAQELLGKSLAPFGINVFVVFMIVTTMTGVYLLINLIVLIMKFVMWIYSWILKLIELVPIFQ